MCAHEFVRADIALGRLTSQRYAQAPVEAAMNTGQIIIKGARTHNLKNVSLEIPKHKMVVFTGVSGSGKSSLVFETLYTEAQRQLIETFSSFSRRFLPKLSRPVVEKLC